jgi:Uma2 family endonuclease
MGSLPALARLTPEEYLDFERDALERHEYVDGFIYAMSGGTPKHARIALNIGSSLEVHFGDGPCQAFGSDLKVWIPKAKSFLYPDVSVVCGELRMKPGSKECVENPKIVFEVLSDSTELYDRTKKFRLYKSIPELKHYLLIQQNEPWVDVFTADDRGFWYLREFTGLDTAVELEAIDFHLPLSAIYRKVDFAADEAVTE